MWYLLVPSSGGELHVADKSSSFTACSSLMFFRAIRGALLFKHIFPDAKRPNVFVCSPAQTGDFIFTLAAFLSLYASMLVSRFLWVQQCIFFIVDCGCVIMDGCWWPPRAEKFMEDMLCCIWCKSPDFHTPSYSKCNQSKHEDFPARKI